MIKLYNKFFYPELEGNAKGTSLFDVVIIVSGLCLTLCYIVSNIM